MRAQKKNKSDDFEGETHVNQYSHDADGYATKAPMRPRRDHGERPRLVNDGQAHGE